jgi:hypothetical protein
MENPKRLGAYRAKTGKHDKPCIDLTEPLIGLPSTPNLMDNNRAQFTA